MLKGTVGDQSCNNCSISNSWKSKCNGNDGSFTITATGGTGTMYSKDDELPNINVFSSLATGKPKWAVKDVWLYQKGHCLEPTLIAVSISAVNPSCCEALTDGSIMVEHHRRN
jgi:hypothetical protein